MYIVWLWLEGITFAQVEADLDGYKTKFKKGMALDLNVVWRCRLTR